MGRSVVVTSQNGHPSACVRERRGGTLYSLQPPLCVVEVNQHAVVERGIDAVCLRPRGRRELLGVLTEAIRPHDQPKVLHALYQ